jgi:hypothetical protein
MDFQKICDALRSCPEVAQTFTHADVVKYIELVSLLKPTPALAYLQPSHQSSVPPPTLPANVHEFLRACFDVPDETAKLAWKLFQQIAWDFEPIPDEQKANRIKHVKLFLRHGIEQQIGMSRNITWTAPAPTDFQGSIHYPLQPESVLTPTTANLSSLTHPS